MNKLQSALGLAAKAGKIKSGDFITEKLLKGGKATLILIDTAASSATTERYENGCAYMGAELLRVDHLGEAIGNPGRMLAAVTDRGFEQMIKRAAEQLSVNNEF